MAEQKLDLSRSVYELCTAFPGILPILVAAGFSDITKPGMLATAGRFMTLPKGAAMKKMDLKQVVYTLEAGGYTVEEEHA